MPGTVWAPAWVAWRYSEEWIGWAPLPPEARWDVAVGLRFGGSQRIAPSEWCFVDRRGLLDRHLRDQIAPLAGNVTLLERTREATRYAARAGRPLDVGPDVGAVERMIGRSVPRMRVVDLRSPMGGRPVLGASGAIGFFRPSLRPAEPADRPPRAPQRPAGRTPDRQSIQRSAAERQRLESSLAREQARLEGQQQRELRSPPAGVDRDALRQRHENERRAFQSHVEQQRRVLEMRLRNRIVRPQRPADGDRPGSRGRGRGDGRSGRD
jgi:hypothetical protein